MAEPIVQPIPEAAIDAGYDILLDWQPMFETTHDVSTRIVEAAAPFIARAARIAEIRAIADWLDEEADRDILDADSRPYAADRLRERADEMEAS